ncbi:class I SAM-dependent methyltransferase [Clostridium botulinum]|uniref:class I SAM-dependent methyltransferase n=1 Tax=Clostridium botulinum TaxID=1491 RepID=UPI003DA6569D
MKTFDYIWEEIHKEQEWGKYPSEEVIRFVARNFYKLDRKNIKILDFGCGTGAVTWYIAREGFDAYGFDGSETAIKKAQKRIEEEGVKASLQVADAANIAYKDDFFDAIIDSAVIYANKINDIKNILNEAKRVLKNGGKIFSTGLFNCKTTGYGTGDKIEDGTYRELTEGALAHRGTVHFFEVNEIKRIWQEVGFKNIKIDSVERTDIGGKYTVGFFIVEAEK